MYKHGFPPRTSSGTTGAEIRLPALHHEVRRDRARAYLCSSPCHGSCIYLLPRSDKAHFNQIIKSKVRMNRMNQNSFTTERPGSAAAGRRPLKPEASLHHGLPGIQLFPVWRSRIGRAR